jgi:glycosyltransferase involved in cell wall biosynthesis
LSKILYISYDGMLEPLGESQVVSYLDRLAAKHGITLLSFEKSDDLADRARVSRMQERLARHGIEWVRLRYHRWPPVASTAFDILAGIARARAACRRGGIRVVHARGYVPALIAMNARRGGRAKFLFDMRGFWVDEKVEAGHWKAGGVLFRVGKWCEQRFFRSADAIVSLTEAGVRTLSSLGYPIQVGVPVVVIPTCVDLQRFTDRPKDPTLVSELGLAGADVIGCVGTMSGWYMRSEMLQFLALVVRASTRVRVLIVTREDHAELRRDCETAGIPPDRLIIRRARFADMPRMISLFDAGVFFIRPSMSKRGSAATKLAEFLACGVPVIINDGVGDSGEIVAQRGVGLVLPTLDEGGFDGSLGQVDTLLADSSIGGRCRRTAEELFSVQEGAERYGRLYEQLSTALSHR